MALILDDHGDADGHDDDEEDDKTKNSLHNYRVQRRVLFLRVPYFRGA